MKVVYNGVVIERALTTSWNEVVQYDEAGVNMLGSKITMTVEGTVTSASLLGYPDTPHTTIPRPSSGEPLPENVAYNYRLNNVLRLLEMPRQTLEVYDDANGALLFAAYAADYFDSVSNVAEETKRNMDVDNGPKPRNVQVVQQIRNYARVSFTVDVMKIRCLGGETGETPLGDDPTQGFVVSNRCWTEESLDEAFYITSPGDCESQTREKAFTSTATYTILRLKLGFTGKAFVFPSRKTACRSTTQLPISNVERRRRTHAQESTGARSM